MLIKNGIADKRELFLNCLKYSGILHGLRNFSNTNTLQILMYHRVIGKQYNFPYYLEGIDPAIFDLQMQFLSKHFAVMPLEEATDYIRIGKILPRNALSITVDDGYKDSYTNIYPILKKYNLPATIFLVTGHINSSKMFWVDKIAYLFKNGNPIKPCYENLLLGRMDLGSFKKRAMHVELVIQKLKSLSEKEKSEIIDNLKGFFQILDDELQADYNLSWSEIREMSNTGINFGAHTITHPILTRVPIEAAEKEIKESKEKIEAEIGKSIYGFCYPNGMETDYSDQVIALLKKYRFRYAVTCEWGFNSTNSDLFTLKRVGPNDNDSMTRFEYICSGGFALKDRVPKIFRGSK